MPTKLGRILRIALVVILLLVVVGYPVLSLAAYNAFSLPGKPLTGDPSSPFQNVSFQSRGQNYQVSAFSMAVPSNPANAMWLILAHGWKASRHAPGELERANDFRALGYNILSIDLSGGAGDTKGTGRVELGAQERYDVLGAFDYLLAQGVPAGHIGVVGTSLGAATSLLAAGLEPRIKAIWADSPYADPYQEIREQTAQYGFAEFFFPGSMFWSWVLVGRRIWESRAIDQASAFADAKQVIQLAHCSNDTFIFVHHSQDLLAAYTNKGVSASLWTETCSTEIEISQLFKVIHAVLFTDFHSAYLQRLDSFFKMNLQP